MLADGVDQCHLRIQAFRGFQYAGQSLVKPCLVQLLAVKEFRVQQIDQQ